MIGLVAAGVGVAIVPADMNCIQFSGVVYRESPTPEPTRRCSSPQREGDRNEHLRSLYRVLKLYARLHRERQGQG